MQLGCDVCLSVCLSVLLSVIGMYGICDKHPQGARCNLDLTSGREQRTYAAMDFEHRQKQTHQRLPVDLDLV